MMKSKNYCPQLKLWAVGCIFLILLIAPLTTFAQVEADSVESDSIGVSDEIESLVEQTATDDESSLLDELDEVLFTNVKAELRSRLIQKLQEAEGYSSSSYLGSSLKSYQRLKFYQGEHIAGGLLFEKDAGEEQFTNFTSGFLQLKSIGPFTKIIAGDFLVEGGQGISLWRGYDVSKGVNVVAPVQRKARGLVPYSSADEHGFLRGVAFQFESSDFSVTGFYSNRKLNGTLDTTSGRETITSIYTSGYYRTENEKQKQSTFTENMFGGTVTYKLSETNTVGLNGYYSSYSLPLMLSNGFSNDENSIVSLNYNFVFQKLKLFGEWGRSSSNAISGNSSFLLKPTQQIDIITSYRNYGTGFFNLHGNGFAEGSDLSNEEGWYLGMKMKLHRLLNVSSYFDVFRFPEATFSSLFPSHGNDFMMNVESRFVNKLLATLRYSRKRIEEDGAIRTKQSIRVNGDYKLSRNVKLRGRVEFVDVDKNNLKEKGLLAYGDVGVNATRNLSFNFRLVFFKTDSFDAGVAEYENDLPGVLSVPILYGEGVRWYMFVKYEVINALQLTMKYSDIIREDVKRIGSGLDELPSNHDNRIGLQIDYRL